MLVAKRLLFLMYILRSFQFSKLLHMMTSKNCNTIECGSQSKYDLEIHKQSHYKRG